MRAAELAAWAALAAELDQLGPGPAMRGASLPTWEHTDPEAAELDELAAWDDLAAEAVGLTTTSGPVLRRPETWAGAEGPPAKLIVTVPRQAGKTTLLRGLS